LPTSPRFAQRQTTKRNVQEEMRESYIYLITNTIDHKRYVGQHDGSKSNYFGSGSYLKRAVIKHGKEAFTRDVLCKGNFDSELLDLLEVEAIEKYQTYIHLYPHKGYNLTLGGNGQYGYKPSNYTIRKIKQNSPTSRKVNQFTVDGEFLTEYQSISEAARQIKIANSSILRCACGSLRTAGGFIWSFNKEVEPITRRPSVFAYNLDGKFAKSFYSMIEAAHEVGTTYTAISNACKSKGQSCGFQWRTKKYDNVGKYTIKLNASRLTAKRNSKPVRVLTMQGEFIRSFDSIADASDYLGCHKSGILNVLHGKQTHAYGHTFEYDRGVEKRYNKNTKGKCCPIRVMNCPVTGKLFTAHGTMKISKDGWEQRANSNDKRIASTAQFILRHKYINKEDKVILNITT